MTFRFRSPSFIFLLVSLLAIHTATCTPKIHGDVVLHRIESLAEVEDAHEPGTLFFFDIDDTLIDSATCLGSKEWRRYIKKTAKDSKGVNWHDVLSLYLARNYPIALVEEETARFVRDLQNRGFAVFGLTARERQKWYDTHVPGVDVMTVSQLQSVGIQLDGHPSFSPILDAPEYYQGIFFVDLDFKGDYVKRLFSYGKALPAKVVFFDDKLKHVESVADALKTLGLSGVCYWYAATDKKDREFDPLIANIQLYYFMLSGEERVLSNEEASLLSEDEPDMTAEEYLKKILEMAAFLH